MKSCCFKYLITCCCMFVGLYLQGQNPDLVIDKKEILIGEQAQVTLSVRIKKNSSQQIQFPSVGDTLVKNVEVVSRTPVDTLVTGADVSETRLEQKLFITSFDSGFYAIPPFKFTINGEVKETEAFLLTVNTVEVDTTGTIKDIQEIYEVSVSWLDYLKIYWPYAAGGIVLLAVLVATVILIRKNRQKRKLQPKPQPKVVVPPHVEAINRLEEIRNQKIYQKGKVKEFHTDITDTLRTYIERRFQILATEQTSSEILNNLRFTEIPDDSRTHLRRILFLADMVKFAKEKPSPNENEDSLSKAFDFVENTKAEPKEEKKEAEEE